MLRSLALAIVLAALAPAPAGAVVGERLIPFLDEADGVRVVDTPRGKVARFGRTKAASKVWRRISGRRTAIECDTEDGSVGSSRGPRERGRRVLLPAERGSHVCTIATRGRGDGGGCFEDETEAGFCVRAILALDAAGRRHIEEVVASWDLLFVALQSATLGVDGEDLDRVEELLGDRLVRLTDPSATPPAGAIGLWIDGDDLAVVVLTASGERRFLSLLGGVLSTNAMNLLEFRAPSLLP